MQIFIVNVRKGNFVEVLMRLNEEVRGGVEFEAFRIDENVAKCIVGEDLQNEHRGE